MESPNCPFALPVIAEGVYLDGFNDKVHAAFDRTEEAAYAAAAINAYAAAQAMPAERAPQGEIRDRVLDLIELAGGIAEVDLGRKIILLCHEVLAVERDFTDRAQTLAGRSLEQAARIRELEAELEKLKSKSDREIVQIGDGDIGTIGPDLDAFGN